MIKNITLRNFKCFKESSSFDFTRLNLLTGINGRGKSSVLQSLLLLKQSSDVGNRFKKLIINGELLTLGNFEDIKNVDISTKENICISLTRGLYIADSNMPFDLCYGENEEDQLVGSLIQNEEIVPFSKENSDIDLVVALSGLHYISADRLGPTQYVRKSSITEDLYVGSRGENVINVLAHPNLPLVNERMYIGDNARTVIQQTSEWLSYILCGGRIEIKGKEKESSILYMLLNNKNSSSNFKPTNVGFGYSYILPLIVAGLVAKIGGILIVENPEAHLHPQAQSRLAEFFSRVASTGVQVFIESHSEHILNGLRVSTLKKDIYLSSSDLTIYYFNENFEVDKLELESSGKIANWPKGFFDQQEASLAEIFRLSRQ